MPHRAFSDLAEALALLSRLPVPAHDPRGASSAWAWPVAGACLAILSGGVGVLALWLGMSAGVAAALTLIAGAMLTGALHEDGLADTADGLFGGRDRVRRLDIMKDSRVGSYGVLALVLVTLLRWSALTALAEAGALLPAMIAAAALSRAVMGMVMAELPNARGSGFAHATGRPPGRTALLGVALALLTAALVSGAAVVALALAAGLAAFAVARMARARIGGQTGDILGATQQLAEGAVLVAATAVMI